MRMKSLNWEGIGTKNLFPHTSMPDGLVHESEEKLRAHLSAHGDPVSDWTTTRT